MSAPKTSPSKGLTDLNAASLHEAARAYASMGWPIIPLWPRDKRPANKNGLASPLETLDQIDEWWSKRPDLNIALRTGDVFDVLDLDGKQGMESLQFYLIQWQIDHGQPLTQYRHPGPIAKTGKGAHLLFQPTGGRNFANKHPGLDFRGQRGYIVAPPSIHPNGHRYIWHRDGELPPAPDWLIDLLTPTRQHTGTRLVPPENQQPIVKVYSEKYGINTLTPVGTRYVTNCIFGTHRDSTPSLVFYPENNSFYCFGCNEWGDTIDLSNFIKSATPPSVVREAREERTA